MSQKMLVYVQAVPVSIHSRAKTFEDLASSEFRMVHSSKAALHRAGELADEIVAIGHSSILREAITRGASEVVSVPLCDDPLVQAESLKNLLTDPSSTSILVGENLDGPFSGAALCGALSLLCDRSLVFDSPLKGEAGGSIVLLRDSGTESFNVDIRRIDEASSKEIPDSSVSGNSTLEKNQPKQSREQTGEQSPEEIALSVSRKLRRLSLN